MPAAIRGRLLLLHERPSPLPREGKQHRLRLRLLLRWRRRERQLHRDLGVDREADRPREGSDESINIAVVADSAVLEDAPEADRAESLP